MMELLTQLTFTIPLWAWIGAVSIIIWTISPHFTQDRKPNTQIPLIIFIVGILLTTVFHFHQYVNNHFISGFDAAGLPTSFTRSGWWLLIDAWPLFLFPFILIACIFVLIYKQFSTSIPSQRYRNEPSESFLPPLVDDGSDPGHKVTKDMDSRQAVMDKIKIQELTHKIKQLEEKYRLVIQEHKIPGAGKSDKYTEEIRVLRGEATTLKQEKSRIEDKLNTTLEELSRANELVDRLLNEKFDKG